MSQVLAPGADFGPHAENPQDEVQGEPSDESRPTAHGPLGGDGTGVLVPILQDTEGGHERSRRPEARAGSVVVGVEPDPGQHAGQAVEAVFGNADDTAIDIETGRVLASTSAASAPARAAVRPRGAPSRTDCDARHGMTYDADEEAAGAAARADAQGAAIDVETGPVPGSVDRGSSAAHATGQPAREDISNTRDPRDPEDTDETEPVAGGIEADLGPGAEQVAEAEVQVHADGADVPARYRQNPGLEAFEVIVEADGALIDVETGRVFVRPPPATPPARARQQRRPRGSPHTREMMPEEFEAVEAAARADAEGVAIDTGARQVPGSVNRGRSAAHAAAQPARADGADVLALDPQDPERGLGDTRGSWTGPAAGGLEADLVRGAERAAEAEVQVHTDGTVMGHETGPVASSLNHVNREAHATVQPARADGADVLAPDPQDPEGENERSRQREARAGRVGGGLEADLVRGAERAAEAEVQVHAVGAVVGNEAGRVPNSSNHASQEAHATVQPPRADDRAADRAGERRTASPAPRQKKRPRQAASSPPTEVADDGSGECPICFESWSTPGPHQICATQCGHLFGRSCIEKWIRSHNKLCPTCKRPLRLAHLRTLYLGSASLDLAAETAKLRRINQGLMEKLEAGNRKYNQLMDRFCEQGERERSRVARRHPHFSFWESSPVLGGRTLDVQPDESIFYSERRNGSRFVVSRRRLECPTPGAQVWPAHTAAIRDVVCAPHATQYRRTFLTASLDKTVKLFDASVPTPVTQIAVATAANSCCWSSSSEHVVYCGGERGQTFAFDLRHAGGHLEYYSHNDLLGPVHSVIALRMRHGAERVYMASPYGLAWTARCARGAPQPSELGLRGFTRSCQSMSEVSYCDGSEHGGSESSVRFLCSFRGDVPINEFWIHSENRPEPAPTRSVGGHTASVPFSKSAAVRSKDGMVVACGDEQSRTVALWGGESVLTMAYLPERIGPMHASVITAVALWWSNDRLSVAAVSDNTLVMSRSEPSQ